MGKWGINVGNDFYKAKNLVPTTFHTTAEIKKLIKVIAAQNGLSQEEMVRKIVEENHMNYEVGTIKHGKRGKKKGINADRTPDV